MSAGKDWQDLVLAGIGECKDAVHECRKDIATVKEDLTDRIDTIFKNEIVPLKESIAVLQVKSGLWGAAAGLLPTTVAIALFMLRYKVPALAAIFPKEP